MAVRTEVRRLPWTALSERPGLPLPIEARECAQALRAALLLGSRGAGRARRHSRRRGDRPGRAGPAGLPAADARAGNLHYAVFDVLWLKGKDLRECPLSRRKRILSRLVKKTSTVLSPVFGVRGRGRDLFRAVERLDLEGIVAKRLADPYTPDTVWRKVRNGGYTQMEGRRDLFHRA
jgi:ATP dependent DNA ligase domain